MVPDSLASTPLDGVHSRFSGMAKILVDCNLDIRASEAAGQGKPVNFIFIVGATYLHLIHLVLYLPSLINCRSEHQHS